LLPERLYLRASKPVLLPVQVDNWLELVQWDFSLLSILLCPNALWLVFGSILMRLLSLSSPKCGNLGYLVISIVFSISPFKSGQRMCGLCFYQQNSRFGLSAEILIAVLSQRGMGAQDADVADTLLSQKPILKRLRLPLRYYLKWCSMLVVSRLIPSSTCGELMLPAAEIKSLVVSQTMSPQCLIPTLLDPNVSVYC
jgi:hypothetical protein